MHRSALLIFVVLLPSGTVSQADAAPLPCPSSPIAIDGTIVKAHASNVQGVPGDSQTAIVHVDGVVKANQPAELQNQDVTVRYRRAASVVEGRKARFCATSWISADHLALIETATGTASDGLPTGDTAAKQAALRERIRARSASPDVAVVVGRVAATHRAPGVVDALPGLRSEHDPVWTEARVQVEKTLKKSATSAPTTASVVFPASSDVAWARAPKLQVGQERIFVLKLVKPHGRVAAVGPPHYTVLDPADVLTLDKLSTATAAVGQK